jgi:hypothetical protein
MKSLGKILNNTFGRAYIKNLPTSYDRLSFVKQEFDKVEMDYIVFPAYDGKKFTRHDKVIDHMGLQIPYPNSAGFIGNQISTQVILMNEINGIGSESFMIFDDDCYFINHKDRNNEDYDTITKNLPLDWDVIIFGPMEIQYSNIKNYEYKKTESHSECAGSHAIAVNKRIYVDWLHILDEKNYWGDGTIYRLLDLGYNLYNIFPGICVQNRSLFSDINQKHH